MLEAEGLRSGYGRVPVLHGVDLRVAAGELVLLLGPNGAGKTTLLQTIAGFIRPQAGTILFDGRSIAGEKPEQLARRGLRLVLEGHRIFPELSVGENLRLGRLMQGRPEVFEQRVSSVRGMFPFLEERERQAASDLSGGQQQLLALTQAFVGSPRLLLCDEPSLGVAQGLIPEIFRFLRDLASAGVGVLVVEQLPEKSVEFADRVIVLRQGVVVAEGAPADFRDERQLRALFLGARG